MVLSSIVNNLFHKGSQDSKGIVRRKVKNVGQSLGEILNKILFICGAHHHTTLILNERVVLCFVDREVCVKPSALRGKPPTPGSQAPTMAVFIFYIC